MKLIFIPVSDRPECRQALHQAFSLGQALGASVLGCHIRPHRDVAAQATPEATASSASIIKADSYDQAWEAAISSKTTADSPKHAHALFAQVAKEYNYPLHKKPHAEPGALWTEQVGSPDRLFAILGPMTDLMVVSRPTKTGQSIAKTIMINAVLYATTPVLVLPQDHQSQALQRIAIGWNQSSEASLAIKAAMPLIAQAKQAHIITHQSGSHLGPQLKHLQAYLNHWGIDSQHLKAKGKSDYEALIQAYDVSGSDLLVMGGYSRSRLRQRLFGGVTENMLNDAKIPVLMMHT